MIRVLHSKRKRQVADLAELQQRRRPKSELERRRQVTSFELGLLSPHSHSHSHSRLGLCLYLINASSRITYIPSFLAAPSPSLADQWHSTSPALCCRLARRPLITRFAFISPDRQQQPLGIKIVVSSHGEKNLVRGTLV